MSELRVDSVKSKGGGAPNLPKGVTISGITTAVTLGATQIDVSNVNVSGVVTSGTLSGSLLSTGTPTLGLGVTINSSGVAISGVATAGIVSATTLYGDGTNLTGIGASIAPLFYQPDPGDTGVSFPAGIGITFNSQVKAGTGNVTLSIANAGVAGTVVENFGVGSSVSISENRITINPTADLSEGQDYIISYPSGCFTNNEGSDYVGTAYTFQARVYINQLWGWGASINGSLGQNLTGSIYYSSPVQIPGTTWSSTKFSAGHYVSGAIKSDNTLWVMGNNYQGQLGINLSGDNGARSSPVQIPGSWSIVTLGYDMSFGLKTDGTLWSWGKGDTGRTGLNIVTAVSSPTQIPGTTWANVHSDAYGGAATKTDGTLWVWGSNNMGQLGQNNPTAYSSPVQIPGTTWSTAAGSLGAAFYAMYGIKTDGTLWGWGRGSTGGLGQNNTTNYSSPIQIPGTTWSKVRGGYYGFATALKTDGTLWAWGFNDQGQLGQNNTTSYSSPKQIPGTTWNDMGAGNYSIAAIKTDGTLWAWGSNQNGGQLGQNQSESSLGFASSPVQIPGTDWHRVDGPLSSGGMFIATKQT